MRGFGSEGAGRGGGRGAAARPPAPPLRQTWPHVAALLKPRKALLALGLGLMLLNRAAGLVLPTASRYFIDHVLLHRQLQWLAPLVGVVLAATALQAATSFALTQSLSKAANRLVNELRGEVQAHIARLPLSFYDANNTGSLVSRVMSDVEGIRNLLGTGLVDFLGGILTALIALGLLLAISPAMTAVALALVALFLVFTRRAFAVIRPVFRERRRLAAEVTGRLTESIAGVRVVKGYHAEDREAAVFQAGLARLLANIFQTLTATSLMDLASKVLMGGVGAIVLYMGAHRVLAGAITPGEWVSFNLYLAYLAAPMMQIVGIGTQYAEAAAGLERTHELLALPLELDDPRRAVTLDPMVGKIEFDHVGFAYDTGPEVLHDIVFTAPAGTVTALVGPSGSGKSTIINLVAAFYAPTRGQVRVDGVDLATVALAGYRSRLGVVLQESFLFDGSLRENVRFGAPAASDEDLLRACRIARVDEFAGRFPRGYDTVVGERGVRLSGGQRQRLTIARAILADPRILILDEATSSLDTESEAMIQEGLRFLLRGRTTFVIAHRLSTIRAADQILVVEGGRILERGTHRELLAARGRYFDLYTRQHHQEENLFLAPGEGGEPAPPPVAAPAAEAAEEPPAPRFF